MNADQKGMTARLLAALLVAGIVTFVLWGVWIVLAIILGALGWLLSSVGGLLQTIMDYMASVRGTVGWVAFGVGGVLGAVLAVSIPLDRLMGPLRRLRRPGRPAA